MNPIFLAGLGNHLWQSTAVAALAGLLTLMLRKHGAHVRYWVWFIACVKFLVPFSLLINLGSAVRWRSAPPIVASPSVVIVAKEIVQPFVTSTPSAVRPSRVGTMRQYVPTILFNSWFVVFFILVALWIRSWSRMRAIVRGASPMVIPLNIPAMASPALLEPSVFGIFRPVLLVPHDIQQRLSEEQLHSVLAHEMCHIRRRDNLLSSVHMTVAAIFWFYPVVRLLGTRLLAERERACDEQVLKEGNAPEVYAEGILRVCKFYMEPPLCASGVGGSNLQRRIEAIISGSPARSVDFQRACLLVAAATAIIAAPIAFGLFNVSAQAQTQPANRPSFEVASVKPNVIGDHRVSIMTQPGGRFVATGVSLKTLIGFAYGVRDFQILGGPDWLDDDRWDIEARTQEGSIPVVGPTNSSIPSPIALRVQSLISDRFRLNLHHDTKEFALYELSTAKGGPKLKLSEDQSAILPPEPGSPPPPVPQRGEPLPRGSMRMGRGELEGTGVSLLGLVRGLSGQLGRTIIDKTGLKGLYDFKLQWIPDMNQGGGLFGRTGPESPPPASDPVGPSIFTAIQEQLGLRLESAKGPVEVIVIDSVQKPSAN